jgi:hypothetical protein
MTESAGLERGYRRLLAAYPASFRREQEEEILAVLMAGAPSQRRPNLAEAVDVIRSGLGMRLRRIWSGPDQGWANALLVIGAAAPLLVVLAGLLEVAVPYPLPPASRDPELFHWSSFAGSPAPRELGGMSLLHVPGFDIAVGGQLIIAVVVLLGLRRLGLAVVVAAAAGFWFTAASYGIPEPMWVLGAAAFPLEAVALIAVPDGRRIRWVLGGQTPSVWSADGNLQTVLRWREAILLLLAAAAIQVLTLMSDAAGRFAWTGVLVSATSHSARWKDMHQPGTGGYVAAVLVLAVVATGLALTLKISRYFLLLVILCYPVVVELIAASVRFGTELMGLPSDGHLALLYLPPLLLLAGIMIVACAGPRRRAIHQPGPA